MSGGEQAAMGQSGFMRPVVIKNRFKPPPEPGSDRQVLAAVVSEISRAKRPRECRGNNCRRTSIRLNVKTSAKTPLPNDDLRR
jgi:hypothetical protein